MAKLEFREQTLTCQSLIAAPHHLPLLTRTQYPLPHAGSQYHTLSTLVKVQYTEQVFHVDRTMNVYLTVLKLVKF